MVNATVTMAYYMQASVFGRAASLRHSGCLSYVLVYFPLHCESVRVSLTASGKPLQATVSPFSPTAPSLPVPGQGPWTRLPNGSPVSFTLSAFTLGTNMASIAVMDAQLGWDIQYNIQVLYALGTAAFETDGVLCLD